MTSTPVQKAERTSIFDSISPWATPRSNTPKPETVPVEDLGSRNQPGADHTLRGRHGLSARRYPKDCPPLDTRWFYAVDAPKRKPKLLKEPSADPKPFAAPKKFVTFSEHDSASIEAHYQKIIEEEEDGGTVSTLPEDNHADTSNPNTSIDEAGEREQNGGRVKVPVNEDFLFDVDIEQRELAPAYWLGPIYEVRRGSWFYQEGSVLRPCEENLAAQLEEGYLKVKPFRYPKLPQNPASRRASMRPDDDRSLNIGTDPNSTMAKDLTPKPSFDNLRTQKAAEEVANVTKELPNIAAHQPQSTRLFGSYINSIVTYQDDTVAWLSSDGIISRMSSTVYQRFAGGAYLGGVKLVRGYTEPGKVAESKPERSSTPQPVAPENSTNPGVHLDERQQRLLKRRSAPPGTFSSLDTSEIQDLEAKPSISETREATLKRQISSMVIESMDPEKGEEAVRRREEREIQVDYQDGNDQSRQIEHLILVTHGIGQRLGLKTETVNFVHDVNVLRQTLKSVYSSSADLQALNSEIDKLPKNCRIQVLPVCWRHLLDFPRQGLRESRRELDIGDTLGDDEEYPSLEDITVEGVPFVRNLISDLGLDILLYQSAYREHITGIVLRECNRIFKLFRDRNPDFKGKVSLIGHSLGSAILFDILCRQGENGKINGLSAPQNQYRHQRPAKGTAKKPVNDLAFDFLVEDFYCLGSPIGLFQMLKGRTIAGRHNPDTMPAESPMDPDQMDDPFLASFSSGYSAGVKISPITGLPYTISSPKCSQLYNIFHPSDPISYRLEPLIAPAMSSLKPQALPYTKKGIFGASASQGFTGIGARVGQSVSGFWSNLSSGIASSILNRSLGLTNEDVSMMGAAQQTPSIETVREVTQPAGAGHGTSGGTMVSSSTRPLVREDSGDKRRLAESTAAADPEYGAHAPTLIDDDIETLYSGFQKRRTDGHGDGPYPNNQEAEANAQKLRKEEMKVRGLNQNGRVDFQIQESVLDFNPMNIIASHLSYWADEDVSHFMLSQLLSRYRTKQAQVMKH